MLASTGYGATRAEAPLARLDFERRDPRRDGKYRFVIERAAPKAGAA